MKRLSLTSLLLGGLASLAAASRRFIEKDSSLVGVEKTYLRHGAHVHYRYRNRKTTTAAALKRAAKKRANMRARSKK